MLAIILALCAVALGLGAVGYTAKALAVLRASVPNKVIEALNDLGQRVKDAEANVADHDTRAIQWRAEMDGVLEAVEGTLDRVTRTRRSTTAAAAKLKGAEIDGPSPGSVADLASRARSQGLM